MLLPQLLNIDPDTRYNKLQHKLVSSISIKGTEETHLTHSRVKQLIVTTKKMKSAAVQEIDQIINSGEIPLSKENTPSRILRINNHQDFITYTNILTGNKETYNDNMTNPPPSSQKHAVSISYDLVINKILKKESRNEESNTRKECFSQQTDLTELTGSTFLESLEANNKLIQKNDELDQNRNKIAKDEILKKVGEMFTSFQSFILKAQRNTNQRTITNEPNYQQHIYTAPPQACPPYYLPSSFYSQSTMNQLHIFSASPEVNHPINFNSVIQTPNQEPPQEVNPANE